MLAILAILTVTPTVQQRVTSAPISRTPRIRCAHAQVELLLSIVPAVSDRSRSGCRIFIEPLFCVLGTTTGPTSGTCTRTCVNGGVCNIVNGTQVCWCLLGYSGSFCELKGQLNQSIAAFRSWYSNRCSRSRHSLFDVTLCRWHLLRTHHRNQYLLLLPMYTRLYRSDMPSMYVFD